MQSDETIKTFLSHVVSASPSCICIELCYIVHNVIGGLSTFMRLLSYDLPLPALLKSLLDRVPSLPNCTIGNNFIWTRLRTEASGTERTDSKHRLWAARVTDLVRPLPPTPIPPLPRQAQFLRWRLCGCGVEHLCQSANINLSLGKT